MCHYKIWDDADRVTLTRKNHIPDSRSHNITFVMTFYNMAQKSQELKEKILQEEKNNEIPEFNEDHNIKSKQISVQRLTNPNISHTINVENNISAEKKNPILMIQRKILLKIFKYVKIMIMKLLSQIPKKKK